MAAFLLENKMNTQTNKASNTNKVSNTNPVNTTNTANASQKVNEPQNLNVQLRVLRIKEVASKLSIGVSTIYDWINPKSPRYDDTFPVPIKLSKTSIGWLSTEVDEWLLNKAQRV